MQIKSCTEGSLVQQWEALVKYDKPQSAVRDPTLQRSHSAACFTVRPPSICLNPALQTKILPDLSVTAAD